MDQNFTHQSAFHLPKPQKAVYGPVLVEGEYSFSMIEGELPNGVPIFYCSTYIPSGPNPRWTNRRLDNGEFAVRRLVELEEHKTELLDAVRQGLEVVTYVQNGESNELFLKAKEGLFKSVLDKHEALGNHGWLPIEDAPKDGTVVFIWTGNSEFPDWHKASWRQPSDDDYWVNGSDAPEEGDGTFDYEPGWFDEDVHGHKFTGTEFPTLYRPVFELPNGKVNHV